jgi:hypothetical protein
MKRTLFGIAGGSVLLFSLAAGIAAAQYSDDEAWHRTRESFYASQDWRMKMFDRIREDLDHVQSLAFTGGDQYRIDRTKQEIGELQTKMTAGQYDQRELDDVVAGLTRVLADNRLTAGDRDMLNDDLSRVRDYRAHHDNWH